MENSVKKGSDNQNWNWKPVYWQFLTVSTIWMMNLMYGLSLGSSTIVIAQIRKEGNSTEAITDEMASWIMSASSYSGVPSGVFLVLTSQLIGRKKTCLIVVLSSLVAFTLFYCSVNVVQILISQAMQGMVAGASGSIGIMVATEYTSARNRGIYCSTNLLMTYLGIWIANALGTFFHWRNIGLLGMATSIYSIVIVITVMPESVYWLASKRRFEECIKSHNDIMGNAENSKELQGLIKSYSIVNTDIKPNKSLSVRTRSTLQQLKQKEVYKPITISILTRCSIFLAGKLVFSVFAIQILKRITNNESAAFIGMLALDGITICGMLVGCVLSKFFNRRTLLLWPYFGGIVALYAITTYLFLIKFQVILEDIYITMILLTLFSVSLSIVIPLVSSVYAEIMPLKCRGLSVCIVSEVCKIIAGTGLKISPRLFSKFGSHGAFLFFAISGTFALIVMYLYLPETKDKTLLEIANLFKDRQEDKKEKELKELIPSKKYNDLILTNT